MQATPVHEPPTIIVQRASDASPLIMVGLIGTGPADALARLAEAAHAAGIEAGTTQGPHRATEVMVVFDSATARNVAISMLHRAEHGEFGALRVEVVLGDPAVVARHAPDWLERLDVEPADYIRDPAE